MSKNQVDDIMHSTAMDLFVEAGFLRNSGKKVVIYVEGDSDRRLYQSMFTSQVACLPAYNYINVEKIISIYDQVTDREELPFILGIVDRDYRVAAGEIPANINLICTELRDIECEMINTKAFENLVAEYSSAKLREKWPEINDFKNVLVKSTSEIGRVRFYSHVKKSGIDFKKINYEKIHDLKKHELISEKLIPHLSGAQKAGTTMHGKYEEVLKLSLEKKYVKHLSISLRLSRGHDLFELLSYYFTKGFGRAGIDVSAATLESAIRIGFIPFAKGSPTVIKILAWFAANNLLRVVR